MSPPVSPGSGQTDGILEARRVSVSFQGIRALSEVDLALRTGEIVGLIGPNGAGKTTFVNVMTGFQEPTRGSVHLDGSDISAWLAERRSLAGVARTFQAVRLFAGLSVLENIEAAGVAVGLGRSDARARAMRILDWLGLADKADARADTLPFGEERRIGIGRALALQPRFLLLDEPAAGLNSAECDQLGTLIQEVRSDLKCGIILIEHKISLVFAICDRIVVLDGGEVIAEGGPSEIRENPRIREAYLGTEAT
jgi:branched-chain amino acid transport system ATP-binding protein